MTEVENRGFIGQGFRDTTKTGKAANTVNFIKGIFHLAIGKTEPVLHAVNAQHACQRGMGWRPQRPEVG